MLNWAEGLVADTSGARFVLILFLLFIPLSLLIPSTSGLATVAMPIMVPLAAFAGVAGELVVSAFQFGSGVVNLITPTSAVVMGGLAIARVGYGTWWKFSFPLLLILGAPLRGWPRHRLGDIEITRWLTRGTTSWRWVVSEPAMDSSRCADRRRTVLAGSRGAEDRAIVTARRPRGWSLVTICRLTFVAGID